MLRKDIINPDEYHFICEPAAITLFRLFSYARARRPRGRLTTEDGPTLTRFSKYCRIIRDTSGPPVATGELPRPGPCEPPYLSGLQYSVIVFSTLGQVFRRGSGEASWEEVAMAVEREERIATVLDTTIEMCLLGENVRRLEHKIADHGTNIELFLVVEKAGKTQFNIFARLEYRYNTDNNDNEDEQESEEPRETQEDAYCALRWIMMLPESGRLCIRYDSSYGQCVVLRCDHPLYPSLCVFTTVC